MKVGAVVLQFQPTVPKHAYLDQLETELSQHLRNTEFQTDPLWTH